MADVGLGELATLSGRYRNKVLRDAVSDSHPLYYVMKETGGIKRVPGGRQYVEEALSGQNGTVDWVGESGQVSLQNYKVADAAVYEWKYQLGSMSITMAEKLKNSGGGDLKFIDIVSAKEDALEYSAMNEFHEGMLSNGTGSGGLQLIGLAALVSTTPTTGTVGTIDRSNSNAAWFRNQKFDTASDWSEGAVDAGNVKRFLDKLLNSTTRHSKSMLTCIFLGQTHWEHATQAFQAHQWITTSNEGKVGFEKMIYRGVPLYFGAGVNYSGLTAMTATRTYGLCTKPGGVNLVFHKDAEFEMLEPVNSGDQAAYTRLLFTMCCMTIGGLAKFSIVGFD